MLTLSALKKLLRRIAGLEDRVEKLEQRPVSIGHLLHAGGEIKPGEGQSLFDALVKRQRETSRSGGADDFVARQKRFLQDNRCTDEIKWRD
jgi:hypothetical protein